MNTELRKEFYSKHENFHHTFDDGDYYLEYGLFGSLPLQKDLHLEIQEASKRMYDILMRVKERIKTLPKSELLRLGYHERIIPFLHIDHLTTGSITSRFDIIRTNDSFKFIELNNDTPFLIMENYNMDDHLNLALGKNSVYPRRQELLTIALIRALEESAMYLNKSVPECTIAVMGYDLEEDLEEFTTLTFFQELIKKQGINCHYINYADIRVDMNQEDVYSDKTGTIDILLKPAYPYEFLIEDQYNDKEGYIGLDLMKLMDKKKVALLNPPASHILQNKGTFAYIFELIEETNFFTIEETKFLLKYLPYTSFSDNPFKGGKYVRKPVISREGQSVHIISPDETHKSSINLYDDELAIYQEFIQLPKRKAPVEGKEQELYEILGVFIANNAYSGTVCRLGGIITDWYSHWIALHEV